MATCFNDRVNTTITAKPVSVPAPLQIQAAYSLPAILTTRMKPDEVTAYFKALKL